MSGSTASTRHEVDPGRQVQPGRGVLRRRRSRQDHHRRGDGGASRRVRPCRRGADHRPRQTAGTSVGNQGTRQHPAAGAAGSRGIRRTARDDARHAPHIRRDGHRILGNRTRTSDSGQPVLSDGSHVAGRHAGIHGHGEARPAARARTAGTSSWWTPRRRATRWTSSTPPNGWAVSWTAGSGGCCWPRGGASGAW